MKINGSILGPVNTTSTAGAVGVWGNQEVFYAKKNDTWPIFSPYFIATGGNVTYDGNFKIHTFLSSANLVVIGGPTTGDVEYLVVGGGGAGGSADGAAGGGGAGGFRTGTVSILPLQVGVAVLVADQ
jgi:hypothetical protein